MYIKVHIHGNRGNMGKRYAAILDYLKIPFGGSDLDDSPLIGSYKNYTHHIIATPTLTHLKFIRDLYSFRVPILCEKPLFSIYPTGKGNLNEKFEKKMEDLKYTLSLFQGSGSQLTMIDQYKYALKKKIKSGTTLVADLTSYDYYHSGSDKIAWDCINIIGAAVGKIELKAKSPIWKCSINGIKLNLQDINEAYVDMIDDWLYGPYIPQYDSIIDKHQKVLDYLDGKFN